MRFWEDEDKTIIIMASDSAEIGAHFLWGRVKEKRWGPLLGA